MTGKTHVACGTTALLVLNLNQSLYVPYVPNRVLYAVGLATVGLGSLLPDIDIPDSKLGHMVPLISKHLTHRGITHTLLFPLILFYGTILCMNNMIIGGLLFGLFFGWIFHIFADLFNRKGVPLLWPLMTQHFHVATVKTRSVGERIFLVIWCVVCLALSQL